MRRVQDSNLHGISPNGFRDHRLTNSAQPAPPLQTTFILNILPVRCQNIKYKIRLRRIPVDPRGIEPRTPPCHGGVLPVYHGPLTFLRYEFIPIIVAVNPLESKPAGKSQNKKGEKISHTADKNDEQSQTDIKPVVQMYYILPDGKPKRPDFSGLAGFFSGYILSEKKSQDCPQGKRN